jgi:glycosyltransferase involved in cell wall biosynthesis
VKIAFVTPRYGCEIGGGAESLVREYAKRLADRHEVTILTTCALDYKTWADHYPPGDDRDGRVVVRRFSVPSPRDVTAFDAISAKVISEAPAPQETEEAWMDAQGPNAPGLLAHLESEGDRYDVVVFCPYLYATTVRGLRPVADRAVLVPALHDEPWLQLKIFDAPVRSARALVLSTPEELQLAQERFGVEEERAHVVGAGIDPVSRADPARFRATYGVTRDYVLCIGRIDPSKGSAELLRYHGTYRRIRRTGPDLVMIGRPAMPVPDAEWVVAPGFVPERDKHDAIAGSLAVVAPSPYESLSLVLLEAWAHGRPTVASARSPVLVGQSQRSGGGLWYQDVAEYAACIDLLATRPALARALGRSGWRFAQGLRWPDIMERLERALRQAARAPSREGLAP